MYNLFPNFDYAPLINQVVFCSLSALLGYILAFKVRYFDELDIKPVVPPFVGVLTTLFALMIAFMASAAWQNSTNAYSAYQLEQMAVKKLYMMPMAQPEYLKKKNKYLQEYVSIVQKEEWGRLRNMQPVKEAGYKIDSLLQFFFSIKQIESNQEKELGNEAVRFVEELNSGRDKRLYLGHMAEFKYLYKWVIIYLLVFLCCFNIAIIHRGRPKAAKVALLLFALGSILMISTVSLYLHPYMGPHALHASEFPLIPDP